MIIAFEGIDGSGKTTQAGLLAKWLRAEGHAVCETAWNSSPVVKRATKHAKKYHDVDPATLSILAAADFADRLHNEIRPALRDGQIVVADRWIHTGFARDVARGLNRESVFNLYDVVQAPVPDLCFYLVVSVATAMARIQSERSLKYYESGMDLGLAKGRADSFRIFQGRVLDGYGSMIARQCFIAIDGNLGVSAQQKLIRSHLLKLENAKELAA